MLKFLLRKHLQTSPSAGIWREFHPCLQACAFALALSLPFAPGCTKDRHEPPPPAEVHEEGRFVVQVGAYSDGGTLRDTRQKVEKLGLKTYTQVIDSDGGKRTRVRVGPFATRAEAQSAVAKLKAAGLPANLIVL